MKLIVSMSLITNQSNTIIRILCLKLFLEFKPKNIHIISLCIMIQNMIKEPVGQFRTIDDKQ